MPYQVLARKWRPQHFEDVVGQRAVTETLRNAITSGRIAQAFVFAGPRGVGKTTTARILARALNCAEGPTARPCGACDACREIADGRDIDVLEIDAATHTGVDNVRAVIIEGLAIPPVRNRYKIFVIDEVHQLSSSAFNALLKSIEEPPPHAAFIMATTELQKVPETILSRAQVFEFRTIASRAIAAKLRAIADAEQLTVPDEALALVARAAEGSMRDAQTAFDQVIAFAGERVSLDDVAAVLGLVGRDLLFDILEAVADEEAGAAFELAGRAIEAGHDLRLVVRELARLVRDLLVVVIDPARVSDPEIAAEGERERLVALAARFSREDLLRAFDVLARAEIDIRNAAEPRYHLEMALLRWMHLRKLVPLERVIADLQAGGGATGAPSAGGQVPVPGGGRPATPRGPGGSGGSRSAPAGDADAASRPAGPRRLDDARQALARQVEARRAQSAPAGAASPEAGAPGLTRERFLAEIQQARGVFARTVVAQAQRIEVEAGEVVFTFLPAHGMLKEQVEQQRAWLETLAGRLAGRPVRVRSTFGPAPAVGPAAGGAAGPAAPAADRAELRARALADPAVQAMLQVFPAEIKDVEEM